jgi:hypothetical protein
VFATPLFWKNAPLIVLIGVDKNYSQVESLLVGVHVSHIHSFMAALRAELMLPCIQYRYTKLGIL